MYEWRYLPLSSTVARVGCLNIGRRYSSRLRSTTADTTYVIVSPVRVVIFTPDFRRLRASIVIFSYNSAVIVRQPGRNSSTAVYYYYYDYYAAFQSDSRRTENVPGSVYENERGTDRVVRETTRTSYQYGLR